MSIEHEIVALELQAMAIKLTVATRTLERMAPPGEPVALRGHRFRKIKFQEAKADAYDKASQLLMCLKDAGKDDRIDISIIPGES